MAFSTYTRSSPKALLASLRARAQAEPSSSGEATSPRPLPPPPPPRPGEGRLRGEEPVAGVDRMRPARERRVEDAVDPQVGLPRRGGTDRSRLVGQPHVQGCPGGLGIDGEGGDAPPP